MAYDPTDLDPLTDSGRVNIVRLLVGDTDLTEEQLSDEEILYHLNNASDKPSVAAVHVAYSLASKYARLVNTELEGVLKEDYSDLSAQYYTLATRLKAEVTRGNLSVGLPPSLAASGVGADPIFTVDQFDNPRAKETYDGV